MEKGFFLLLWNNYILNCKQVCRRNIFLQINQGFCTQLTSRSTPTDLPNQTKFLTLDLALHGGKQVAVKVVVAAAQMNLLTEILVQIGWVGGSAASTLFGLNNRKEEGSKEKGSMGALMGWIVFGTSFLD